MVALQRAAGHARRVLAIPGTSSKNAQSSATSVLRHAPGSPEALVVIEAIVHDWWQVANRAGCVAAMLAAFAPCAVAAAFPRLLHLLALSP
jgi:hypothetical protein